MIYYLDRLPDENDYENIQEVTGEICSDIEFEAVEEVCEYSLEDFSKLDKLDAWVYIRQE